MIRWHLGSNGQNERCQQNAILKLLGGMHTVSPIGATHCLTQYSAMHIRQYGDVQCRTTFLYVVKKRHYRPTGTQGPNYKGRIKYINGMYVGLLDQLYRGYQSQWQFDELTCHSMSATNQHQRWEATRQYPHDLQHTSVVITAHSP